MMDAPSVGAIILAAGLSSRMGEFKPLLRLGEQTLVEHCTRTFRDAGVNNIILVTGHNAAQLTEHGKHIELTIVENSQYLSGMFSSVQTGVAALPETTAGFFMLPVDIPLFRPATVRALLQHFKPGVDDVLIPCFYGEQGHPPLISGALIPRILAYDGSGGLQALFANCNSRELTVWDRFILRDADTQSDFGYLRQQYQRREIPTRRETTMLLSELVPVPGHAHGLLVARIGVLLGEALNNCGHRLDLDLIYAGGCLHDLAKGLPDHATVAAQKLRELGLDKVADTVEQHSAMAIGEEEPLDERHLVCLADKLVSGATIVEPKQRYLDKLDKYQNSQQTQEIIKKKMQNGLILQKRVENILERPIVKIVREKLP